MAMAAPVISEVELSAFHAAHFSATSTTHFAAEFLGPVDGQGIEGKVGDDIYYEEEYVEAEDDGLGYYADGVKRTLTDEQIAIFRHSEIETLLRERRHAKEAKDVAETDGEIDEGAPTPLPAPVQQSVPEPLRPIIGPVMESSLEDGELEDDTPEALTSTTADGDTSAQNKKKRNKKKKEPKIQNREPKPKGFFRQSVKPDLRKRTWDVVERGVDGLDYDDMDGGGAAKPSMAKRRQISYDDW